MSVSNAWNHGTLRQRDDSPTNAHETAPIDGRAAHACQIRDTVTTMDEPTSTEASIVASGHRRLAEADTTISAPRKAPAVMCVYIRGRGALSCTAHAVQCSALQGSEES